MKNSFNGIIVLCAFLALAVCPLFICGCGAKDDPLIPGAVMRSPAPVKAPRPVAAPADAQEFTETLDGESLPAEASSLTETRGNESL